MRMKKKVDKFAAIPEEFKDAVLGSTPDEIKARIAKVAMDQVTLEEAKKEDHDLKAKVEDAKFAGEVYREGKKMNKLKIEFCKRTLEDKGVAT